MALANLVASARCGLPLLEHPAAAHPMIRAGCAAPQLRKSSLEAPTEGPVTVASQVQSKEECMLWVYE